MTCRLWGRPEFGGRGLWEEQHRRRRNRPGCWGRNTIWHWRQLIRSVSARDSRAWAAVDWPALAVPANRNPHRRGSCAGWWRFHLNNLPISCQLLATRARTTLFHSNLYLFISVYICLYLFTAVCICLQLFVSVYICLQLFVSVYICLQLFVSVSQVRISPSMMDMVLTDSFSMTFCSKLILATWASFSASMTAFFLSVSASFSTTFWYSLAIISFVFSASLHPDNPFSYSLDILSWHEVFARRLIRQLGVTEITMDSLPTYTSS